MANITYYESPSFDIANHLLKRGYEISSSDGEKVEEPNTDCVGILQPMPSVEKSFLGFKRKKKRRSLHIATIWVENKSIHAVDDKRWVLHIFDRTKIVELTSLFKELVEKKQVDLHVELKTEKPKEETFFADYMYY